MDKLSNCEPYSKLLVQTVAVITLYNQLALPKTFLIKDLYIHYLHYSVWNNVHVL